MYSVLHTSPAILLKEIILVDDASTEGEAAGGPEEGQRLPGPGTEGRFSAYCRASRLVVKQGAGRRQVRGGKMGDRRQGDHVSRAWTSHKELQKLSSSGF